AHSATLLSNGTVLVAGGNNANSALATAEIYSPGTNVWFTAGPMNVARYFHTTNLLADGRVLVSAGYGGGGDLSSAEIYDPATNSWSSAGVMSAARDSHTAIRLTDGRVFVAGGFGGSGDLTSAEIYTPEMNAWSLAASLSSGRIQHAAALLADGKVLVSGGINRFNSVLASAEIYAYAIPAVAINDVNIIPSNSATTAVFTVTLSPASDLPVTVSYSTANGTATAGSNYVPQSGIITFGPGDSAKTITISIIGRVSKPKETFFVNLTTATNATIADGQGIGTIIVNDTRLLTNGEAQYADLNGDGKA